MKNIQKIWPHIDDIRRLASPCLDLCLISEGKMSGNAEFLKIWDFASGSLFLEEVGLSHNLESFAKLNGPMNDFYFIGGSRELVESIQKAIS